MIFADFLGHFHVGSLRVLGTTDGCYSGIAGCLKRGATSVFF